jgi:antirestriction protein
MPYEIAPTTSFPTEEHVQEHLEGLLEDGHDQDEMKEFIETHGNSDFLCYYEDYARMVDQYDQETVDAFLETFDMMDIEHLEDAYHGQYDSEEEFAENFVSDMGYICNELPYWIKIDWKETWEDGLSWDYTFSSGYVFSNNW